MPASELTTSRINRLLRPLRTKCLNLAALTTHVSTSAGVSTYSNYTTWVPHEKPPLAILLPPVALRKRSQLEQDGARFVERAKRVYAVRDAFRNVLRGALQVAPVKTGKEQTMSLSALCATLVGEKILEEVAANAAEDDERGENVEDEEEMAIVDEMYEYVPAHHRRWTIVAHAVRLIFQTCPSDPTLLTLLLDVTLEYRLARESSLILHALLDVAICAPPSSSDRAPICHPAHRSYLSALLSKWTLPPTTSQNPAEPDFSADTDPEFSPRSFTVVLYDVLVAYAKPQVWAGKPVRRFARELCATHFPSFTRLATALAHYISSHRSDTTGSDDMSRRLEKWINAMFNALRCGDLDIDEALQTIHTGHVLDEYSAVVDFLVNTADLPLAAEVRDSITSLTTFCIVSPLLASLSSLDAAKLFSLLRDTHPTANAYADLASVIFPRSRSGLASTASRSVASHSAQPPALGSPLYILRTLRLYAAVLRTHGLMRHEVALWAGALKLLEAQFLTVEAMGAADGRLRAALRLRDDLADVVDEAEQRCFGLGGKLDRGEQGGSKIDEDGVEWVWEDLVDSWVQKTPARPTGRHPAARGEHPRMSRSQLVIEANVAPVKSSHTSSTRPLLPSASVTSTESYHDRVVSSSDDADEDEDEEDEWVQQTPMPPPKRRPRSAALRNKAPPGPVPRPVFGEMSANRASAAVEKRASARPEAQPVPTRKRSAHDGQSASTRSPPRKVAKRGSPRRHALGSENTDIRERGDGRPKVGAAPKRAPARERAPVLPSSDDVLDLFSYPNSSPVVVRGRGG